MGAELEPPCVAFRRPVPGPRRLRDAEDPLLAEDFADRLLERVPRCDDEPLKRPLLRVVGDLFTSECRAAERPGFTAGRRAPEPSCSRGTGIAVLLSCHVYCVAGNIEKRKGPGREGPACGELGRVEART